MAEEGFVCQLCGRCCSDLVSEDHGIIRGLTLLPGEEEAFPRSIVKPAVGIGINPNDSVFRITAFQMTENKCPYIQETFCKIYKKRPASCRQFPFSLRLRSDGRKQMGFDLNCPALISLLRKNPRPRFDLNDKSYAEKLLSVDVEAISNSKMAWYFDLGSEKWILYNELTK